MDTEARLAITALLKLFDRTAIDELVEQECSEMSADQLASVLRLLVLFGSARQSLLLSAIAKSQQVRACTP